MRDLSLDRDFWKVASTFPPNKETVYPAHTRVQQFDLHTGKVVVEYGCGGGSDTESWARRGNAVQAFDIVPINVETTRKRLTLVLPRATVQVTLLEDSAPLPLEGASVDIVSSHGVVHHIAPPRHAAVMAEFFRVLRSGGLLYLMLYTELLWARCVPHMAGHPAAWEPEVRFSYCTDGGGWARKYTEQEARDFIEGAGFVLEAADLWNNGDFRTYRAVRP